MLPSNMTFHAVQYRNWLYVQASWNVMAHAQKQDFVFRLNGRVHLNRWGHHFSRLLAAEVCASAVVMLDTPCCELVWRVLTTHSFRQFPLHFLYRASPCAFAFQLESTQHHCHRGVVCFRKDSVCHIIAQWKSLSEEYTLGELYRTSLSLEAPNYCL